MASPEEELKQVLMGPRESLGLELKQWIDPTTPDGIAKIAKGCIALRNNNGGRLVIGFTDDGKPDSDNIPDDVRSAFHIDDVQAIVSKYASDPFSIDVHFVTIDGNQYPVITVPPGVRIPVAAKSDLKGADGKLLVRDHAVYVRSLHSNNTVSSTEARRADWGRITRHCFDNREADIGGFVRRHLASLNLESLGTLAQVLGATPRATEMARVEHALDAGRSRFDAVIEERQVQLPDVGTRESVVIVNGEFVKQTATASFRRKLLLSAPNHTGWPPWVDLANSEEPYPSSIRNRSGLAGSRNLPTTYRLLANAV